MESKVIQSYDPNLLKAKLVYNQCNKIVRDQSATYKEYIESLHRLVPYGDMIQINYKPFDMSNEELIEMAREFFYSLNDKTIRRSVDYIIRNKLIEFREVKDKEEGHENYSGITQKKYNDDVFIKIIVYRHHNIYDLETTIHELGHAISFKFATRHHLYNINMVVRLFLSEYEAYFFEPIFCKYFLPKYIPEQPFIGDVLDSRRFLYIASNIWAVKFQELIFNESPIIFDPDRINEKTKGISNRFNIDKTWEKFIFSQTIYQFHSAIHSYLLALESFNNYKVDPEKELIRYKMMITAKDKKFQDMEELYKRFGVNYPNNTDLLEEAIKEYDILTKRLALEKGKGDIYVD